MRQPIGIGALLETIATWTELLIGEMVISSMPEADGSQLVERHIARGEYLRDVYDEELTDYSAAIHMLSVRTGTKDMFLSYSLGALVASVALNLPEKWFPSLLHPKPFEEFGKDVLDGFKSSLNRGYLFAAIVWHGQKFSPDVGRNEWLNNALNAAGLPTHDDILDDALLEMKRIAAVKIPGERGQTLSYLLSCGHAIFETRRTVPGIVFQSLEDQRFITPPIFDCSGELIILNKNFPDPKHWHPYAAYDTASNFDKESKNFRSACR